MRALTPKRRLGAMKGMYHASGELLRRWIGRLDKEIERMFLGEDEE